MIRSNVRYATLLSEGEQRVGVGGGRLVSVSHEDGEVGVLRLVLSFVAALEGCRRQVGSEQRYRDAQHFLKGRESAVLDVRKNCSVLLLLLLLLLYTRLIAVFSRSEDVAKYRNTRRGSHARGVYSIHDTSHVETARVK